MHMYISQSQHGISGKQYHFKAMPETTFILQKTDFQDDDNDNADDGDCVRVFNDLRTAKYLFRLVLL